MSEVSVAEPQLGTQDLPQAVPAPDFSARRTLGQAVLHAIQTYGSMNMGNLSAVVNKWGFTKAPSVYAEVWRLKRLGVIAADENGILSIADLSKIPAGFGSMPSRARGAAAKVAAKAKAARPYNRRVPRGPYNKPSGLMGKLATVSVEPAKPELVATETRLAQSLLAEVLHDAITLGTKIQRLSTAMRAEPNRDMLSSLLSGLGVNRA